MKNIFLVAIIVVFVGCNSSKIDKQKFSEKSDPKLNTLVIFKKHKIYTDDYKYVLDTLFAVKHDYKIIGRRDSIKLFTNSNYIEKVILVNKNSTIIK